MIIMKEKIQIGIISLLLIGMFCATGAVLADNPHDSYIVCGQISTSGGAHPNDVTIIIENEDTGESLSRETYNDGEFQFNLGNMPSGWSRGANMTISTSDGYAGSTAFTINDDGTIQQQDLTVSPTGGGGGGREAGIDPEPQGMILIYIVFGILLVAIMGAALYMYEKNQS